MLHVGGYDVDQKMNVNTFGAKYKSLVESLVDKNCSVFISSLIPRGGINMKPYNEVLKNMCESLTIIFIANHDSFIMASGELPFEFYHADKVNLKFGGIHALIQNINRQCTVLPKYNQSQPMSNPPRYYRDVRGIQMVEGADPDLFPCTRSMNLGADLLSTEHKILFLRY